MAGVIIHEWVEQIGGSEKVLDAMLETFPNADLLCAWNNAPERYLDRTARETVLARTPLRGRKALSLPVMPFTWRGQRSHDYEWALVSSHAFAHHVSFRGTGPDFHKFVYVHTPARYVWNPELDARGDNALVRLVASGLKGVDRRRAAEATSVVANSDYVRERILRNWGIEAGVIHPPVDVTEIQAVADWRERLTDQERSTLDALPAEFLLGASRLIPYKRLDLVIQAGAHAGLPVVIAGSGPEEAALRALAAGTSSPVTFLGSPSNALLRALYQRASALVFPAVEDFGIMPVEAMAAGTPVIGIDRGGVTETIEDGVTGSFVSDWTDPVGIRAAIERARSTDPETIAAHARSFSKERFDDALRSWVR
ncbi:glycosyltransferase [Microbacteriaceae bacterium VKM Ac-2855]|nr:glycosyltransferase [Microbacteriaceae bacterium VKM Ac-2855]